MIFPNNRRTECRYSVKINPTPTAFWNIEFKQESINAIVRSEFFGKVSNYGRA